MIRTNQTTTNTAELEEFQKAVHKLDWKPSPRAVFAGVFALLYCVAWPLMQAAFPKSGTLAFRLLVVALVVVFAWWRKRRKTASVDTNWQTMD